MTLETITWLCNADDPTAQLGRVGYTLEDIFDKDNSDRTWRDYE
jgi:hypothetical protein